ncbi:MAG: hypothetical protein QOE55_3512 [Acidobacteriaceae bacterium]|jgi:hypothetical protein|nr:hypothetical protein [Acidobacteriaceae bacterium]
MEIRFEVQATRQGGRKLNFDLSNQLFAPKSAASYSSGVAKCVASRIIICRSVSELFVVFAFSRDR